MYLSKQLADNLFVFQYPSKRLEQSLEDEEVVKSCVKPIHQEVKVDFALDTASLHYDAFKGEQFAIAADGKEQRNEKISFRSGTMDRQSFVSTKPMDNVSKYIVGYLHEKEIHATIVKGVVQMRPSFSYFDKSDTRKKAEQKLDNESDADDDEPKQVTVKFARNDTDRLKKAREKSYNYLTQKSADEPWCETMWYPPDSIHAQLERQKLFATSNQATGHSLSLTSNEYVDTLIPAERTISNLDAILPPRVISMSKLKGLPLTDQVRNILKDGKFPCICIKAIVTNINFLIYFLRTVKVVPFSKLMELIDTKIHTEEKVSGRIATTLLCLPLATRINQLINYLEIKIFRFFEHCPPLDCLYMEIGSFNRKYFIQRNRYLPQMVCQLN